MVMGAGVAGVLALAVVGGLAYRFMPSHASAAVGPPAVSATAALVAKPIESSAPLALAASSASTQLQDQDPPPMATLTAPAADAGGHAAAVTTVAVSRGPVSAKPSADSVHTALNGVLPGARQCSASETVRADVIFRPDGGVLSVSVYDTDVSRVKDCVKAALSKAHVPPFSDPSYSVSVTVRPL